MRIVSKFARDFDCDWQRVNAFSHCVTLTRVLLLQINSYSDTKVPVLVVMECKHANLIYVYELIFFSPYFKVNRVYILVQCATICDPAPLNEAL